MEKTTFVILPQCKALNGKWSYDNARLIHKIRVFIQLYLCTYVLTAPLQGGVCTWEDEGGGKGEGGRGGEGSGERERESCEAEP